MDADVLFDASTTKSEPLLFGSFSFHFGAVTRWFLMKSETWRAKTQRTLAKKKKSCRLARQQSGQKRSLSFGGGRLFVSVSIQCQQVLCWRSPCRFLPSRFVGLPCRKGEKRSTLCHFGFVSKRTSCRWTREWLARHVTRSVNVIGPMFALQFESVDRVWSVTRHVTCALDT